MPLPPLLDLAAIAVFALAARCWPRGCELTFVTLAFFALVTGVGGGTMRDLLIDAPVFWIRDPWVAPVCLGIALVAWVTPRRWWEHQMFEWADAVGLAVYSVVGTAKALTYRRRAGAGDPDGDASPAASAASFAMCWPGVPSILIRPELYVTAAALSAALRALGTRQPASRGRLERGRGGRVRLARARRSGVELNLPAYSRD